MKSTAILALVIIIQLGAIGFLANKILFNRVNILGKQVVNPIQKKNIIYPNTELKHFYEPKPNSVEVLNDWVPYKGTYTINSDALNERYEYGVEKQSDVFRIITLGDSFTYGLYVDTKDNWTEKLEDKLNSSIKCAHIRKFEVLNLGVGGYDIQYPIERFKNRGLKYTPDLVIWLLKDDDVYQINEIMLEKEKVIAKDMRASGEFQREVDKGNFYPSWNKAYKEFYNEYGEDRILSRQQKFLAEFNILYKGHLLVINFPHSSPDLSNLLSTGFHNRPDYSLLTLTNIHADEELYFANDYHPTRKGHDVIADDLYAYLKNDPLISCK